MIQKFFRGQRVRVYRPAAFGGSHFSAYLEAIVVGSYADICTGTKERDFQQFSVAPIDKGVVVNRVSWYDEGQLELLSDDRHAGEILLQEYQERFIVGMRDNG